MMNIDPEDLSQFKERLRKAREQHQSWERSRRLVAASEVPGTLRRLCAAIEQSPLSPELRAALLNSLGTGRAERIQDLSGVQLKQLTGLPVTKAVRTLCLLFGLIDQVVSRPVTNLSSAAIEEFVQHHANPYDLLLEADVASLLDLGAGDLSFAEELADQYVGRLAAQEKTLTLHCLDRLQPGSKLGGPLHASHARLQKLKALNSKAREFRFWGNQDMFALEQNPEVWPTYTVVTCHAPATPTFAYEPTRVSPAIITEHLRRTKGDFQIVREDTEEALQVLHSGKALLFPSWKFEIRGPLALLDLISRRGRLCVLSSVDAEMFWELLSQLSEDPRLRPKDVLLTRDVIPGVFGEIHRTLSALPLGETIRLSDVTAPRQALPRVLDGAGAQGRSHRFRHVMIRRGAVLPGIPSSLTARLFKDMKEEDVPWFVTLVPEGDLPAGG
jgi:hypothetical protein